MKLLKYSCKRPLPLSPQNGVQKEGAHFQELMVHQEIDHLKCPSRCCFKSRIVAAQSAGIVATSTTACVQIITDDG